MTDIISTVTKVEADLIVRDRAAAYVEAHGPDYTLDGFPFWVTRLSNDVGAELDRRTLIDVVISMDDTAQVENGTHPLIQLNAAGTVDNRAALLDYEGGILTKMINHLLTAAGFTGGTVNGTGKQAA